MRQLIAKWFGFDKDINAKITANQGLTALIGRLRADLEWYKEHLSSAKAVASSIFPGISWFDYNELKGEMARTYYRDAQTILNSDAFKNEVARLESEFIKHITIASDNFRDVRDGRMQISGLKLILERLEEIPNPDIPDGTHNDVHRGI